MADNKRKLGQVKILQVQPSGLIHDVPGGSLYDPSHRVEVPQLLLTPRGVEGVTSQGHRLLDIHHADHPNTHSNGRNAISIGFTSHYQAMRERFGNHLKDGTAGENIIITAGAEIGLADLGPEIELFNPDSKETVTLEVYKIAAPCEEFSHFAANSQDRRLPADELKRTLQFLGDGRRGFLLSLKAGQVNGLVQTGDLVYAVH